MKKFSALALSFVFSVVVVAAALSVKAEAGSGNSGPITIGSVVEDFKLPDAAGKEHSLASLKGSKGTALIFVSTGCPVSNAYNERMKKLAQDFKARGIHVVGINSNVAETPEMISAHA
ncbi:MAG: redoxin domain-containing protein, partial [Acidobacteriota bacterium]|nr:redoxin domain-containing protein [Acidobacteriota bacterium]